jgi:hypothetical protein
MENPECSPTLPTQQQISFLGLLPDELIVQILHGLSPLDLLSIGQVRTAPFANLCQLPRLCRVQRRSSLTCNHIPTDLFPPALDIVLSIYMASCVVSK